MRIVTALLVVAMTCTATPPSPSPAAATPVGGGSPAIATSPIVFRVGALSARFVATTVTFVDAFNAGRLDDVLALVADDVVGGDCDLGDGSLVTFNGKASFAAWLRGRIADHDRLEIQSIFNENPDPSTGGRVVGVEWAGRTSDALRARGLAEGLGPHGAAKVVFTADGRRIRAWNNGSAEGCRVAAR